MMRLPCFECSDPAHFITDCLKRKKFDSFNKNDYGNKYDYTNRNDSSNKGDSKNNRFRDNKKKFQKIRSRACAALSNFDFSSEDTSSSEED
jgi:hypothetical protein